MKEKYLPIDRARHAVYTKKAKQCVLRLLHRYDDQTCEQLWERIQLQYCAFLRDEPPMVGAKIKISIYDPILIFAWYKVVPDKPGLEEVQQDIFDCFMGSFDALGKIFNLNRRLDNRLASRIFQKANNIRVEEIRRFPGSFRMGSCSYDGENGVIRYSFTQCPNAEFAKRHHMEDVLPVMCNCDHQSKKGNQWHFGYKAHIGADTDTGLIHTLETTAGNVSDVSMTSKLLTGEEEEVNGDAGYLGANKREDAITRNKFGKKIKYRICRRPSTLKKLSRSGQYKARKAEHRKSSVRCKVEHVFGVVKNLFRCRKTRYRGKAKVDSQLKMVFALANLFLADTRYGLQA